MKKILEKILANLAKKILTKYNPEIIGITGSVGKTSTKETVHAVLRDSFNVRTNIKNYNTEIGVPLTIIHTESAGKNIFRWLIIIFKAWKLILIKDKNYPQILILEMAADHPGDIKYLVKLAPCKIGIVTAVGASHTEFFGSVKGVAQEKSNIVSHLKKSDTAILNIDDNLVYKMQKKTSASVLTYGLSEHAQIRAFDIHYSNGDGVECKISNSLSTVPAKFKNVLASSQISSILAALAVAQTYNLNLKESSDSLKDFRFPAGRLQLLPGIKKTKIIDDTYNSSPKAVKVALEVLSRIKCTGRRWAVLGDMLELGVLTEPAHKEIGEWIKSFKVDILVTVGERTKDTAQIVENNWLPPEKVITFSNADEAKVFIQNEIEPDDLILIKGSQGMRMEKIVKEIMAEPNKAKILLVRQSKKWLK